MHDEARVGTQDLSTLELNPPLEAEEPADRVAHDSLMLKRGAGLGRDAHTRNWCSARVESHVGWRWTRDSDIDGLLKEPPLSPKRKLPGLPDSRNALWAQCAVSVAMDLSTASTRSGGRDVQPGTLVIRCGLCRCIL